jgi:hypothetical protein
MVEKVENPKYRKTEKLYSDMGGEDYAEVEVLSVWQELEENEYGEEVSQYYYKFEFTNEHSPHEEGKVIDKREAEDFEEAWNRKL